jgi:methyl-accepting chemotaxis protein
MVLLVGAIIAVMVAQGAYNLWATSKVAQAGQDMYEQDLLGVQVALEMEATYLNLATALNQHLTSSTADEFDALEKSVAGFDAQFRSDLADFEKTVRLSKEREVVANIKQEWADYQEHISSLYELDRQGKASVAKTTVVPEMRTSRARLVAELNNLVSIQKTDAKQRNDANRRLAAATRNISVLGIIAVAICYFCMALYAPTLIAKPLGEVQEVLDAVGNGDLTKRTTFTGRNEITAVAVAANKTVDALRHLVSQVAQTSHQVAASSQQLAASAGEVGHVTQSVAVTIGELAQGADEQAKSAQETGRVVEQMSAAIQQVDVSAQHMAGDANQAVATAEEGRSTLGRAISQMDTIRETVDRSATAVEGLGDRSQEIGRIVEVITGIADQTNLLALNAAIEAARAGEQGRGFAVVAEEVRKLAEQSRSAAEQISGLIREIQGETAKAVNAMASGTKEVAAGAEVIRNTEQAFEAVTLAVQNVVEQIREVSAATKQLAAGSDHVVRAVESIAAITQESAASSQEVSANSQQQTASVQEIVAGTDSLSGLATELQRSVEVFRL